MNNNQSRNYHWQILISTEFSFIINAETIAKINCKEKINISTFIYSIHFNFYNKKKQKICTKEILNWTQVINQWNSLTTWYYNIKKVIQVVTFVCLPYVIHCMLIISYSRSGAINITYEVFDNKVWRREKKTLFFTNIWLS